MDAEKMLMENFELLYQMLSLNVQWLCSLKHLGQITQN